METQDILQGAILKIRTKTQAKFTPHQADFISEPHKGLFPILEIYDEQGQDEDINNKTKFIHEFLTDEQGTARDKIMHILNELPPISNEPVLNRIWKYCRLKDDYRKTIKRAEVLNQRMRGV